MKGLHHMSNFQFDHSEEFDLLPGIANHSRVDLGPIRTPLEKLPRLGKELGIHLYAKRDDSHPLGMGGNKVRQLEYYFGPALEMGADTVLITGAVQSNFVRLCAAAARKVGWQPVVQLENRVPKDDADYRNSGNVLLDRIFGAEVHYFSEGENEKAADENLDRIANKIRAEGRNPYVIHLGIDHSPLGGLGYALAAAETKIQLDGLQVSPDCVVIPSGSGLTHSGFLCGARTINWGVPVHGICVRRPADLQCKRILKRSLELNDMLIGGQPVSNEDIIVDDSVLSPGYGQLNDQVREAIELTARLEGVLLDPVYSGRCMAGLIDLVRIGKINKGDQVLFIHTGGLPGIFAYVEELSKLHQSD